MMTYILTSALLLSLFYTGFALLLSRETFHWFNRIVLLLVMVASMVLPAVHIEAELPTVEVYRIRPAVSKMVAESMVEPPTEASTYVSTKATAIHPYVGFPVRKTIAVVYFCGILVTLIFLGRDVLVLLHTLHGGLRVKDDRGNTIIIRGGNAAPFSFLRFIVISATDYERNRRAILTHEQEHIRLCHSFDMLLWQLLAVVQWFNPFVYLLGRELRAIHEYQADEAVIQKGIDASKYQILLVTKAVGVRLQTLANSLSRNSLKNRILMMQKQKTPAVAMLKAACLLPIVTLALAVQSKGAAHTPQTDNGEYTYTFVRNDSLEYKPGMTMPVSANRRYEMAQYWLEQHMQYTDEMRRRGIGGNFTVQPYVRADGSFGTVKMDENIDPVLRAEVMRLLKAMPPALMKGLLPLTTKQGYAYLTVSIFDRSLSHQPFNERKPLVRYHELNGPKVPKRLRASYTVNVPLGARLTDQTDTRIVTRRDMIYVNGMASDYLSVGSSSAAIIMLNGKPFNSDNMPDLPADSLKEIVFSKEKGGSYVFESGGGYSIATATGERFTIDLRTK